MEDNIYSKAYVEVLEIINNLSIEEYKKIPEDIIKFFEDNKSSNYEFKIDPNEDIEKQNISEEAGAILIGLYVDYFATDEEKKQINEILTMKDIIINQNKEKKYNSDNLFNDIKFSKKIENEEQIQPQHALVEYKENCFTKFKKFIMKLLHLKFWI